MVNFLCFAGIKFRGWPQKPRNSRNLVLAKISSFKVEATSLRQLSPSLRYFVLSETLHCAIIKFGNVIVSWLSIKFAFTLYCAIIKFGNVIVSRLSLKFAFTLHCAIIKFGNVIVSRLKFAFTSTVNKYNNNCLLHSLPGKLPWVIVTPSQARDVT